MINLNTALDIAKRKYPEYFPLRCFQYKDQYIFAFSPNKNFKDGDTDAFFVSINRENGENKLFDFWKEILENNDPDFDIAINNPIIVE